MDKGNTVFEEDRNGHKPSRNETKKSHSLNGHGPFSAKELDELGRNRVNYYIKVLGMSPKTAKTLVNSAMSSLAEDIELLHQTG